MPEKRSARGIYLSPTGGSIVKQIVRCVRRLVALESWREGERIPSSDSLARTLGVAPNTVHEAYLRLMEAKVLVTDGARGTKVAVGARSSALLAEVVHDSLAEAVSLVCSLGVSRALLEKTMREIVAVRFERTGGEGDEDGD